MDTNERRAEPRAETVRAPSAVQHGSERSSAIRVNSCPFVVYRQVRPVLWPNAPDHRRRADDAQNET
jgi:hypothetical protein